MARGQRVATCAISEAAWQEQVTQLAGLLGWQFLHVRRTIGRHGQWTTATSVTGFPDLLLWHESQVRVVAAELKSERGRLTAAQRAVLRSLELAGLETYVWRPSQLAEVQQILTNRRS